MLQKYIFPGTFGEVAVINGSVTFDPGLNSTSQWAIDPSLAPPNAADLAGSGSDCANGTRTDIEPTILSEIPAKEIIIVCLMLALWIYSILLTKKAWYRILKE